MIAPGNDRKRPLRRRLAEQRLCRVLDGCRCSPCRWRSAVAWRSRSREGSVPARRGRSWRRRFVGVDAGLDIIQLRREFGLRQLPVAGFSLPLRFMDGGGPCAITPAGSTLGVPDDQIRRLRPRRPMPRWPRTGGRGLWSRTAVSGRPGGAAASRRGGSTAAVPDDQVLELEAGQAVGIVVDSRAAPS